MEHYLTSAITWLISGPSLWQAAKIVACVALLFVSVGSVVLGGAVVVWRWVRG